MLLGLTLLALGIVIDRLFWLKRWLNRVPPVVDLPKPPEPIEPSEQRWDSPAADRNTDAKRPDGPD